MQELGKPFAIGRTAEIFSWGEGKVLKLYRDWCPADWVEKEAHIAQIVSQAGVPSPRAGDIITVSGRRGLIYERLDGPDMLTALKNSPLRIPQYGKMLARLHLAMHECTTAELPPYRGGMTYAIQHAPHLPEPLRQVALEKLEKLPDDSRLCHCDFHPGNVLLTGRGPVVIDWMTAARGHPAADIARTRLLLTIGDPPQGGFLRFLLLFVRKTFLNSYLNTYRQVHPEMVDLSDAFLPVMAAARLMEDITPERGKLVRMVEGDGETA